MSVSTKHYSQKQEKLISEYLGWSTVSGSGARDCHPGDIRSLNWLGECKTHTDSGKKITFKLDVWKKICKEAESKFKFPVLFVDDGSQRVDKTWCLFRCNFKDLQNILVVPYPYAIKTNIIFNHDHMLDVSRQYINFDKYDTLVFATRFDGKDVVICKLDTFKQFVIS